MKISSILAPGIIVLSLIASLSCDLNDLFGDTTTSDLSEVDVVAGLKEALGVGIDTASVHLNMVGGYLLNEAIKILLPEDVSKALDFVDNLSGKIGPIKSALNLAGIGIFDFSAFDGMRDSMMVSMNRAAEKAAPLSVSIFKDAITSITIEDGFGILNGNDTAATVYLKTKTFNPLTGVFEPFVEGTLRQVGAQRLWQNISVNFNSVAVFYRRIPQQLRAGLPVLPFDTLTTDLSLYTTQKALFGLFYAVGEQETLIRTDPVARVTEILREVFGSL